MHEDWVKLADEFNPLLSALRSASPDVMRAFGQMAQAAGKSDGLDAKTKELVAFALSVAVRCDPCVAYHAKAAAQLGASRGEMIEALNMAIYMGAGPNVMYAAKGLEAFDQFAARSANPVVVR